MSKSPIIFGIIGKKLYLTILLAFTMILVNVKITIPKGNRLTLINSICGSIIEMISVFIPHIFKFKVNLQLQQENVIKFYSKIISYYF